jgi:succinate dehydrogenase / fumarate reductase cytochrome b subunit
VRPRFLDLRRLSFPPGALASIAHRVSGALLGLATPLAAYAFARSLASADGFDEVARWMRSLPVRIVLALLAAALAYHLFAGLRHLLMDAGIGASLRTGRATAWAVLAAGAIVLIAAAAACLR